MFRKIKGTTMVVKGYRCQDCDTGFAIIEDSIDEDALLSCPSCWGNVEPVVGESEDENTVDDGIDWESLARYFRGGD